MAHVIVVRERLGLYHYSMICVASTWDNAMRLTEAYVHGEKIGWSDKSRLGVIIGTIKSGREFQLSCWKINTKSDEFPREM